MFTKQSLLYGFPRVLKAAPVNADPARLRSHADDEFRIGTISIRVFEASFKPLREGRLATRCSHTDIFRPDVYRTIAKLIIFAKSRFAKQKPMYFQHFGYQIRAKRSWLSDPGFQILATRSLLPDSGFQILATRSWLPVRGCHILATRS